MLELRWAISLLRMRIDYAPEPCCTCTENPHNSKSKCADNTCLIKHCRPSSITQLPIPDRVRCITALDPLYVMHDLLDGRNVIGRAGRVRRDIDTGMLPKWVLGWQGLNAEHIQRSCRNLTAVQRSNEVIIVDHRTATNIDQEASRRHLRQAVVIEQAFRFARQGKNGNNNI